MFLDIHNSKYDRDIVPFIKSGIIIDTSTFLIFINGLIASRISKKKIGELPEYEKLIAFFDIIKLNNDWTKFFITPHILTEVCSNLRNTYRKQHNYKEIVEEIFPFLKDVKEKIVEKSDIISHIDLKNPIIEIGDISIFIAADNFVANNKKKIAILASDSDLNQRFQDNQKVLVMDYRNIMLNKL